MSMFNSDDHGIILTINQSLVLLAFSDGSCSKPQSSVTIISRTCLIGADLIALNVTWHATYRTFQLVQISGKQTKRTFSGTLLRDGASSV